MATDRISEVDITSVSADGSTGARPDQVVTEEPLEIRIEDEPLAVVMRTPGNDIELAAGFLFAEEILKDADDVGNIAHCTDPEDPDLLNVVNVQLSPQRRGSTQALLARRKAERSTVTSASCGVCGKRTIESLHATTEPFTTAPKINVDLVTSLPQKLRKAQEVFAATGGLHAAAIFDAAGSMIVLREDVGRHNAVDKCVGFLYLREMLPLDSSVLMVSGRTSFEIVQKALVAGVQIVASVSAPSSLAIELATASNMGLAGFVRDGALNVYAGTLS